ncbi:MAG: hypothetical protein ACI8P9_003072 [Parasphingorhabdus sp.]|jgi:hypothetical protein
MAVMIENGKPPQKPAKPMEILWANPTMNVDIINTPIRPVKIRTDFGII